MFQDKSEKSQAERHMHMKSHTETYAFRLTKSINNKRESNKMSQKKAGFWEGCEFSPGLLENNLFVN